MSSASQALAPIEVLTPDGQTLVTGASDGQVRIFWGRTPLDLFFDTTEHGMGAGATSVGAT